MKWVGAKGLDGPTGCRVAVAGGGPEELEGSSRGQLWREELLSGLASGATALLGNLEIEEAGKIRLGTVMRSPCALALFSKPAETRRQGLGFFYY